MKYVRTRFFTVIITITLMLVIIPSVLSAMGLKLYVRNAVNSLFTPVQKVFNYAANAIDGYTSYFTEFDRIVEENKELRSIIADLQDQIYSAKELQEMNEWLYGYLEIKREHTDFVLESANVTGRESGNYMTVFTLDKGTAHGVNKGMPVITEYGIAGYITEAGTDWSKAVTILESGSAVGAFVERTGDIGIVEGEYALSSKGICKMTYLPAESEIKAGDRILSSGYGSVYPRGLVIGYVTEIEPDPYSQTLIAYVQPAEKMEDINKLMIITDYEIYTK